LELKRMEERKHAAGRWRREWALAGWACLIGAGCAGQRAAPASDPVAGVRAAPQQAAADVAAADSAQRLAPSSDGGVVVDNLQLDAARRDELRALDDLDPPTRKAFLSLFGQDPLGLVERPANAARYEIPVETNAAVQRWIEYFRDKQPDRFATYLSRSGRYEAMIRSKLRAAHLPEDLLYLAMIESGMNPNAYSRSRAVGLWQFMRGTGRLYRLKIDFWTDERRDPERATDAAVAFLSDLYDEFGSWYLAAAAYNGGKGRVRRGIQRTGSTDFWALSRARVLRRETREYVPKLIAAMIMARDPEAYGFGGVKKEPPEPGYVEVEVPDATSFDVIAEAAGVDEETIRRLNLRYTRHVTPPKQRAIVRLPVGSDVRFAANYARIPASRRVTWLVHSVTRGQTLSYIAVRYGTSVAAIRAANGNISPRRLQIGQRLVIPRIGARPPIRVASAVRVRPAPPPANGAKTITVRRGDSLWLIARRYRISTSDLMAMNDLRSSLIRPGDRLTVRR